MKPITTKGTNSIFGGDGYARLPAEIYMERVEGVDVECIQTVWELSEDDLKLLNENKRIYISLVGEKPQPICVSAEPFVGESNE